jgi:prepilin-type processing-associated H-X9-DG protein/prepilin-type N-terminal cleavage/methylation domain-containing protein
LKTRRAKPAQGFTIIELLVVISVIAMLFTLLLPVLSETRATARSVVCQSNLRQLGVALQLYQSLWQCFPPHAWDVPADRSLGADQAKAATAEASADQNENDGQNRLLWIQQLERMLDMGENMQKCPCTPDWVRGRNNSYGYNYKYLGSARPLSQNGLECFPVKGVADPSHTIAFGDSAGTGTEGPYEAVPLEQRGSALSYEVRKDLIGNQGYLLDPTYIPRRSKECVDANIYADQGSPSFIAPRHKGKANFCMVDGHVEALRFQQVYADNGWWNGYGSEHPLDDHASEKIPGLGRRWQSARKPMLTKGGVVFASCHLGH